ncbi:hypothetical protein Tco_0426125 [Tanacetum coccineum]
MNRSLFTRIVRDLSANCSYFQEGCDAVGKAGISALVKCTSAIRQLAYAAVPDSLDEYLQIGEKTSLWDVLMKSISQTGSNDVKRIRYKQAHEAARKDVGTSVWRAKEKMGYQKGKAISPDFYPEEQHREDDPVRSAQDRLRVIREIHDEETHLNLKADLVEHIWHRTNAN